MQNPDKVEKMVVLNTPLGQKSKLRPELAAYKNQMAFLRPDPKVIFTWCIKIILSACCQSADSNTVWGPHALQFLIAGGSNQRVSILLVLTKPDHDAVLTVCSCSSCTNALHTVITLCLCCRRSVLMVLHTMRLAAHIRCSGILLRDMTWLIKSLDLAVLQ